MKLLLLACLGACFLYSKAQLTRCQTDADCATGCCKRVLMFQLCRHSVLKYLDYCRLDHGEGGCGCDQGLICNPHHMSGIAIEAKQDLSRVGYGLCQRGAGLTPGANASVAVEPSTDKNRHRDHLSQRDKQTITDEQNKQSQRNDAKSHREMQQIATKRQRKQSHRDETNSHRETITHIETKQTITAVLNRQPQRQTVTDKRNKQSLINETNSH
ncbi:hypothetical protein ScPMuIL_018413 [Solemya velum]